MSNTAALVMFSGGQDSTTCLAWALSRYDHVETVGFDYGQRHRAELDCRPTILRAIRERFPAWSSKLKDDHILPIDVLKNLSETALTRDIDLALTDSGLPNTFVPGRNLLFITLAAALAYRRSLRIIVGGMCETDYSGYPDCRDDTIKALQVAINLGFDKRYMLDTPLMWLDKKQIWDFAYELGGEGFIGIVRTETHTCYVGDRTVLHDWGYGCGDCPACQLRAGGYRDYLLSAKSTQDQRYAPTVKSLCR